MAKLVVLYEKPNDQEGFESYYFQNHVPLAQKLPGLTNAKVQKVATSFNTDLNLYLLVELEFESLGQLNAALASEEGMAVQGDVKNLVEYLDKPPIITIVE
ncbi:EthD family reductase [Bacillus timonensis]|nr:EthD family reductase [Bacillus timonensis]